MIQVKNPGTVYLETSNTCNLKCWFCTYHGSDALPFGIDDKRGFMPYDRFQKIVREIRDGISCSPEKLYIAAQWRGDPFAVKNAVERFRYIRQCGFRTGFITNGRLLKEEYHADLIDLGLDVMAFSLDASSEETYSKMRNKQGIGGSNSDDGKLAVVEKSINSLIDMVMDRGLTQPYFRVTFIISDDNRHEAFAFADKWLKRNCVIVFQVMGLADGENRYYKDKLAAPPERIPCPIIMNSMFIDYNGEIFACCGDYLNSLTPGNGFMHSPLEIFRGDVINKLRTSLIESNKSELPDFCRKCELWMETAGPEHFFKGEYIQSELNALMVSLRRTDFGRGHETPVCDESTWNEELHKALEPLERAHKGSR